VVWAERTVPSGLTALLVSMVPLWMAIADWARPGGTRPDARAAAGLLLGFAGLAILVLPDLRAADLRASAGLVALLLASPAWAVGSVYAKRAPLPPSPFMATACEMLGGGAALLVASLLAGEPFRGGWTAAAPSSWAALAYLIVFGSMIGFTAYVWVLTHARLSVASTYAYVNPVVAVLLGWAVMGEPLTGRTLAGGAVVIAAVALITSEA
jgi:drug/metabolite transporter (DMT)-like permease